MSEDIKLNFDTWKVKVKHRSRNRMEVKFKLGSEQAEAFKNWTEAVRPDGIDDDSFYRTIFMHGIEHLNNQLQEMATAQRDAQHKNQEEIRANSEGGENAPETPKFEVMEGDNAPGGETLPPDFQLSQGDDLVPDSETSDAETSK